MYWNVPLLPCPLGASVSAAAACSRAYPRGKCNGHTAGKRVGFGGSQHVVGDGSSWYAENRLPAR